MSDLFEDCQNGDIKACKKIKEKSGMDFCVFRKNWNDKRAILACTGNNLDSDSINKPRDFNAIIYP